MAVVSPTDPEPRFHVSLTDGTDILNFVLYDINNQRDPAAMRRYPVIQSALKTSQGEGRYSDLQFPYTAIAQDEWNGGFGVEDLDKDKSGYWDAENIDGTRENGFFLTGLPQYSRGTGRTMMMYWPDAVNDEVAMIKCNGASRYLATKVVADETGTVDSIIFDGVAIGLPTGNILIDIESDSGGDPDGVSLIGGWQTLSIAFDSDPDSGTFSRSKRRWKGKTTAGTGASVTAGNTYWVIFDLDALNFDAGEDFYLLGIRDTQTSYGKYSADATNWFATTATDTAVAFVCYEANADWKAHFFEYKNNLYFVKVWLDGSTASDVYMLGHRGLADAAGDQYLVDATAAFDTDLPRSGYEPCVAKITAGPASQEDQPWRKITATSSATQMTMKGSWNVSLTTDSEYVVEGPTKWQLIDDGGALTKPVTDVVVVNDMVLLAQGSGNPVVAHREYNEEGVWTATGATAWRTIAPVGGEFMQVQHDFKLGTLLWLAQNNWQPNQYGAWVRRDQAPANWNDSLFLWGGTIEPVTAAWSEYTNPNVAVTYAENAMKIDFAEAFTPALVATQAISSQDLTLMTKIKLSVQTNKDMGAGALQILLDDTALCASPLVTINAPALRKDKQYDLILDVDTEDIDMTAVISVGLKITGTDLGGDHNLYIKSPIEWVIDHDPIKCGKFDVGNITGIEIYDEPERLYVFTEGELGYISGDKYQAVPLREMRSLRSSQNGRTHDVGGVYLYFGLGQDGRVQQYFRQTLTDLGPAKMKGLREDRRGVISALITYPGDRIICAVDGGVKENYSSILLYSQGGWHEIYRAPFISKRIHSLHIQSIEGQSQQRLWFSMDGHVMFMPITFNSVDETFFLFNYYGEVISPWIYMGMHDLRKVFKEIKIFSEDLSRTTVEATEFDIDHGKWVHGSYIADGEAKRKEWQTTLAVNWTLLPGQTRTRIVTTDKFTHLGTDFTTSPVQAVTLGTRGKTCRRLQYKLQIFNTNLGTSPTVEATVLKGYAVQDVKYGYQFSTKATEGDLSLDLEGDEVNSLNYATTVEDAIAKLDSWAATVTPLTMNSIYSPMDNKTVVLNASPMQPFRAIPDDQIEEQYLQITVEEI